MTPEAREKYNAYQREYRRRRRLNLPNPPKIPKIVQTPEEKAVVERMRLLERQAYFKTWLANHPGYMRRDHLKRKGTPKRKADLLKAQAKWHAKNPEKLRAYSRAQWPRKEQRRKERELKAAQTIQAPAVFDPDDTTASPQLDHETSAPHPHSYFDPEFV